MFLGEGLVKPVYLVLLPWAELWATHGLECADYLIILSPRRRLFALENAGCVRKSRANTIQQLNNEWKWVYHLVYCIWPFTVGVAPSAYICNYHNMYIYYICIIYIDIDIVIYVSALTLTDYPSNVWFWLYHLRCTLAPADLRWPTILHVRPAVAPSQRRFLHQTWSWMVPSEARDAPRQMLILCLPLMFSSIKSQLPIYSQEVQWLSTKNNSG